MSLLQVSINASKKGGNVVRRITMVVFLVTSILGGLTLSRADWTPHTVRQLNGRAVEIQLPAKDQILTERWNRRVDDPYLVYMPEKDRLLLLVSRQHPYEPAGSRT